MASTPPGALPSRAGLAVGNLSKLIIIASLIAVSGVLALGLFNMARGGSMSVSQKLMRWRIALQFIAICIIMTAIYFASH